MSQATTPEIGLTKPVGRLPWTRHLPWHLLRLVNFTRRRRPPSPAQMARDDAVLERIVDAALLQARAPKQRRVA